MKCPKCGSKNVVPVIYGTNKFSEALNRLIREKELYLARPGAEEKCPHYHCNGCRRNIGTLPILIGKRGREDYRDIVTSIELYECASRGPDELTIRIKKEDGRISLQVEPCFRDGFPVEREMSESEWNKVLNILYEKAYLHEWKRVYGEHVLVLDGYERSLTVTLIGGRIRKYVR